MLNDRMSFSLVAGMYDYGMASKPSDELFSDGVLIKRGPGEYQPFRYCCPISGILLKDRLSI